jgi:hypothetical protein
MEVGLESSKPRPAWRSRRDVLSFRGRLLTSIQNNSGPPKDFAVVPFRGRLSVRQTNCHGSVGRWCHFWERGKHHVRHIEAASRPDELALALDRMAKAGAQIVIVQPNAMFVNQRKTILRQALAGRLPTIFEAFAAVSAATLPRRPALIAMAAVWAINQAIGFELLGYPRDQTTVMWGIAIGAAAQVAAPVALPARPVGNPQPKRLPIVNRVGDIAKHLAAGLDCSQLHGVSVRPTWSEGNGHPDGFRWVS